VCDEDKTTFNTRNNQLTIYFYETENIKWFKMSIDDGDWITYKPECPEDFLLTVPENVGVKVIIKKQRVMGKAKILFSAFDRNKSSEDYYDDGIREFRNEEEDNPVEKQEE
jgi:hypothetical protein